MDKSYRSKSVPKKENLIVGRQPVIEAIRSARSIDKILFQQGVSGESIGEIRKLARDHQIPIQQVPVQKLNQFTRIHHQGVIALAGFVRYLDLQQVIDHVVASGTPPFLVMLDGITDVRNIGAIARTALTCGVQALIIPDKGVGALNEEARKASAGALEHIQVCRVNSLLKAVDTLHLNGIKVLATAVQDSQSIQNLSFVEPVCIILGSEDLGVSAPLLKSCDARMGIPMKGRFESLNVSVAAGIILYEAMKQREL